MKCPASLILLSTSILSLPALADEQEFDNFLLSSPSIVSPSQFYQVKGGRFEAAAGAFSGRFESKNINSTTDVTGQELAAGYAHALNEQLVLAIDADYGLTNLDTSGVEVDSTATAFRPTFAISLTPLFSLGGRANIISSKLDDDGVTESASYTTFTVGGTFHAEAVEASLALTTKHDDEESLDASDPQVLSMHGRYRFLPVLALGLRLDQADYPGIQGEGELETESSYGVILESALNDFSSVEIAFQSIKNELGIEGREASRIYLAGSYQIASNFELGGRIMLNSGDADTYKYSVNSFAVTVTSRN